MDYLSESDWDVSLSDSPSDSDDEDSDSSDEVSSDSYLEPHVQAEDDSGMTLFKVLHVLQAMDEVGIKLPAFLHAISWGNLECTQNDTVRAARAGLMTSAELPRILQYWWKPPRKKTSHKRRPNGAKQVMEDFAHQCMTTIIRKEMQLLSSIFRSSVGPDVTKEQLTSFDFGSMILSARTQAPILWIILSTIVCKKQVQKNPEKVLNLCFYFDEILYAKKNYR